MRATRVVIADDSAFMRRLISDVLTRSGMEIVALAANGREAIEVCRRTKPDVLSLDLAMPEVDGIEVLRALRPMRDLRTVVVSSFSESDGARAVDALAEGAFDLVPKQSNSGKLQDFLDDLLVKVKTASMTRLGEQRSRPDASETAEPRPYVRPPVRQRLARARAAAAGGRKLAVIASSTGGPRALTAVMAELPSKLGQGVLIVQHMPPGFTKSLAARLDAFSKMRVTEAVAGVKVTAGHALVAPGGFHMRLNGHKILLSDEAPVTGLRPCADITITDAVAEYGPHVVLAVLTGMGHDACAGARRVREAGGIVIAEHGSTTTVNGMPKAVIDAGLADIVVPIDGIAAAIIEAAND